MSIVQTVQAAIVTGAPGEPPAPQPVGVYAWNGAMTPWYSQSNPTPADSPVIFPDGFQSSALTFSNTWTVSQNLGLCNEIEVQMWIYPTSNNCIIVTEQGQAAENTGYHYAMIEIDSSNRIKARSWPQNGPQALTSDPITINAWHHIYFRHSSGTARLEVDGVLVGTDNYARSAPGNSFIGIGSYSITGITSNNRYQGRIHNVQIRNYNFVGSAYAGSNTTYRPSIQFDLDANKNYDPATPNIWHNSAFPAYDCTLYGSPTYVADGSATGTPAAYWTFDRNNLQFGQIQNIPNINVWTIEGLYRLSASYSTINATAVITTIFDLDGGASPDYGVVNFCLGTNGDQVFNANWYGQFFAGGNWRKSIGSNVSYTNSWYHLMATYDGVYLQLYKNGQPLGSPAQFNIASSANGGAIRIGRRWDGADFSSDNYFPGDIAKVGLWYGAMSPGDVYKRYQEAVAQGYPQI